MLHSEHGGWPRLVLLGAGAVGAGMSALLLYEYLTPVAQFCAPGEGCAVVQQSAFGSPLGIPLPVFGLAFFVALLVLALLRSDRARQLLLLASLTGVVAGVALLAIQAFAVGAFCKLCVVVDLAAIAAGVGGVITARRDHDGRVGTPGTIAVAIGLVAPLGLAMALGEPPAPGVSIASGELPEPIAREQRDGVATIVEFIDFECPYCRKQHAAMKPALAEYGDRVQVVYKHVPLPSHPYARPAARAQICAAEQGKGPEMADALFTTENLGDDAITRAAEQAGVDMDALEACLDTARPNEIIERDMADAETVGVLGLPTFYIGDTRMEGLQELPVVTSAIERALEQ